MVAELTDTAASHHVGIEPPPGGDVRSMDKDTDLEAPSTSSKAPQVSRAARPRLRDCGVRGPVGGVECGTKWVLAGKPGRAPSALKRGIPSWRPEAGSARGR